MSGHSPQFDPLHKWLGIPPNEQPPTHYRLLGIQPFESDPEVIDSAANQRMTYLRSFALGEYAEVAEELLNQVARARLCLINPAQRTAYDSALRLYLHPTQSVAAPAPPSLPPSRPAPVSVPSVPNAPVVTESGRGVRSARIRRKSTRPPAWATFVLYFVAPAVGLAMGYTVLCAMNPGYDYLDIFPNRENHPVQHVTVVKESSPKREAHERAPTPDAVKAKLPAEPVAKVDVGAKVVRRKVLEEVPVAIDLPALASGVDNQEASLANLHPIDGSPIEIELLCRIDGDPQTELLILRYRNDGIDEQVWEVVSVLNPIPPANAKPEALADSVAPLDEAIDTAKAIARFGNKKDDLVFSWVGDNVSVQDTLRNCLLRIRAGAEERVVALRTPVKLNPITLDLSENIQVVPLDAVPHGLTSKSLNLEVLGVHDSPPVAKFEPPEQRVAAAKPLRIIFRDQVPSAEVRAALAVAKDKMVLRLTPLMTDGDDDSLPWSATQVSRMERTLQGNLTRGQARLQAIDTELRQINSQAASLRAIPANSLRYAAAQGELRNLTSRATLLTREGKLLAKNVAVWGPRLTLLPPLIELNKTSSRLVR